MPVDENGNRISNEEFKLNYIVDFAEADFAQRLVDEINGEMPAATVISKETLEKVAKDRHMDTNALVIELMTKGYINFELEINSEKREAFFADCNAAFYSRQKKHIKFDGMNTITALSFH